MMPRHPCESYRQIATQTATPGQLVLMLYDGAIASLERAMTGFQQDDPLELNRTINNNILRAQAILGELNASLNMEVGGEFAATMRRLYNYFDSRLHDSNMAKNPEGIQEVLHRLGVLREAWAEMLQKCTAPAVVGLS